MTVITFQWLISTLLFQKQITSNLLNLFKYCEIGEKNPYSRENRRYFKAFKWFTTNTSRTLVSQTRGLSTLTIIELNNIYLKQEKTRNEYSRNGKSELAKFRTPTGSMREKLNSSFQTGLRQLFITLVFAVWQRIYKHTT